MKVLLALTLLTGTCAFTVQRTSYGRNTWLKASKAPYEWNADSSDADFDIYDSLAEDTNEVSYIPSVGTQEKWETLVPIHVQGGSLRTRCFSEDSERIEIFLKSEGRILNADIDLWYSPTNAPQKMSVYLEDGTLYPFRCTVESPGKSNTVAIRNTGSVEFPLTAAVESETSQASESNNLFQTSSPHLIQGGAVYSTSFPVEVESVQVLLRTDGRPLNAKVELLHGPNSIKQVMDLYSEDGDQRTFYFIIDTPGSANVLRVVNTAGQEFPMSAFIEPYIVDKNKMKDSSKATRKPLVWN